MRALIIAAMLFVTCPRARWTSARACQSNTAKYLWSATMAASKTGSTYFPYGSTCQLKWRLPMWLVVKRIVGDSVLLTVDLNNQMAELSCPHGTETSMPYAQARKRYEDYVRTLDDKVFSDLNVGN